MYKGAGNNGMTLTPIQVGNASDINGHDILKRIYSADGKSPTLNAHGGGNTEPKVAIGAALRGRSKDENGKNVEWKSVKPKQQLELRKDEKSNTVSSVTKDSLVALVQRPRGKNKGAITELDDKTPTITPSAWEQNHHLVKGLHYRKLTPLECERLQTLPDNYTEGVSNTQRYKMIGNGWTIAVITHILNNIKGENHG
jgi:site-specific DNA-cytosine methylase